MRGAGFGEFFDFAEANFDGELSAFGAYGFGVGRAGGKCAGDGFFGECGERFQWGSATSQNGPNFYAATSTGSVSATGTGALRAALQRSPSPLSLCVTCEMKVEPSARRCSFTSLWQCGQRTQCRHP